MMQFFNGQSVSEKHLVRSGSWPIFPVGKNTAEIFSVWTTSSFNIFQMQETDTLQTCWVLFCQIVKTGFEIASRNRVRGLW